MKLSFAVLLATANKWRGVRMDVFTARKVEELRSEFLSQVTSGESAAYVSSGSPDSFSDRFLSLMSFGFAVFFRPFRVRSWASRKRRISSI